MPWVAFAISVWSKPPRPAGSGVFDAGSYRLGVPAVCLSPAGPSQPPAFSSAAFLCCSSVCSSSSSAALSSRPPAARPASSPSFSRSEVRSRVRLSLRSFFNFQTGARALVGVVVIRVTTLYAAGAGVSAAYYTGYLTKADGEQPGVWAGSQASGLGLSGEVTTEALKALLSGYHPTTGMQLGRELVDRVDRHGNTIKAVAGYDATLSAPKPLRCCGHSRVTKGSRSVMTSPSMRSRQ